LAAARAAAVLAVEERLLERLKVSAEIV